MSAAAPAVVPKATAEWFSGKRLGLANGILYVMWSGGAMVATQFSATFFSPRLGGWQHVLFLYGIPAVLLGFIWWITGRDPDRLEAATTPAPEKIPFRQAISHIAHMKEVWIIAIITLFNWGAGMETGRLPAALS